MSRRICPWWLGYLLLLPLRRIRQDPRRLLGPFVREGMTVLEPGPGMGYLTLEVARMVGPAGRVVAVDDREKMMLKALRRRAGKVGVREEEFKASLRLALRAGFEREGGVRFPGARAVVLARR